MRDEAEIGRALDEHYSTGPMPGTGLLDEPTAALTGLEYEVIECAVRWRQATNNTELDLQPRYEAKRRAEVLMGNAVDRLIEARQREQKSGA